MKKSLSGLALVLCAHFAAPLSIASPFSESYAAYQQALAGQDKAQVALTAAKAYELGQGYFESDSIDLVNLELNLATALQDNGESQAAHEHFNNVIQVYRKHFGRDAIELVDPLIGAAQTMAASREKVDLFKQAIAIAEDADKPLLLAEVKMLTFHGLASTRFYTREIRDEALEAYEIYRQEMPADALARLKATYYVGMIKAAEKKYDKAVPLLEEVIKQFSVLDFSHPYKLAAHARLVEIYEAEGESDKSTQHCVAIGSMKPWSEKQEQAPLYREAPKYPISYARDRREGWTQMSFTVDEQGFVRDPVVLASEGGQQFTRESLKAIKRWRYAPKFVDGKPVPAEVSVQLEYKVN
ncbi:TonB family protein [Shewanella sp. KCT]|uniref:TonB family protein n=1 Tax=Shewanella sp. KCT TaxID=2569535 RepID=UPI0011830EE2|nr:TonB family protein [Shewanella sp. KCT]TVP11467.1 energy transducer TonB [Shewanella sp. KCT]